MRVLRILDVVAQSSQGLSLAEISTMLAAPKSSLLLLLRALVSEGYLTHNGSAYAMGAQTYRLASLVMSGRKLTRLMRPYMEELALQTQETVILSVLHRETATAAYIEVIESPHLVRYTVPVGMTRPLYSTSGGRVLLAWQDEAWRRTYLAKVKLEPLTPFGITDRNAFKAEIDKIREMGYAVSKGQAIASAAGVGVPLLGSDARIVAALSVGCPSDRFASRKALMISSLLDVKKRVVGLL